MIYNTTYKCLVSAFIVILSLLRQPAYTCFLSSKNVFVYKQKLMLWKYKHGY